MVVEAEMKKRTRPLFGANGVVCAKKEKGVKRNSEKFKKGLDNVGIVRDVRLARLPGPEVVPGIVAVAIRL